MLALDALPDAIRPYAAGAAVTTLKAKKRASVYRLDGSHGASILKIAPARERLSREAAMLRFLAACGLAPAPLCLAEADGVEYLVMEALEGRDAADDRLLADPPKLCELFAESLLRLRALDASACPVENRLSDMAARAAANYRGGRCDPSLLRYLDYDDPAAAFRDMTDIARSVARIQDESVIHGDYCLPNVMLAGDRLAGFVDVGYGGTGDPHYDLFWGAWSLQFNLSGVRWAQRFLDAYGRHRVDSDRLRLCGLLSVFNGFRGQDYYA